TLMERLPAYQVVTELARGKVNQVRCQAADWRTGGLQLPSDLVEEIRQTSLAFGRTVTATTAEAPRLGQKALQLGYESARHLVRTYVDQVFHIRHQRQAQLDTTLGCRLVAAPPAPGLDET